MSRLPYSMKILLENLLRREDDAFVKADDIRALAQWNATANVEKEISFMPARVLLQDFTGVPCVVDLAAMRDAVVALGGNPDRVNPLQPVELVIDHSVQVDYFGRADAFALNAELEFSRNRERYAFLRWGQRAFNNFKVVPPDTGIVHQVNIEHLARVVFSETVDGVTVAYPDTLVGTDSHTTMVNGLGVVGWGVGGIEAEAAMLGQPSSMLIPQVLGFRLTGAMPKGTTATDLVLTITEILRKHGVVGKFVEFYRRRPERTDDRRPRDARQHVPRVRRDRRDLPDRRDDARLSAADRPRRGAGHAGRGSTRRRRDCSARRARPTLSTRRSSISISARSNRAWPVRSGRRIACRCRRAKTAFQTALPSMQCRRKGGVGSRRRRRSRLWRVAEPAVDALDHGAVVIAAITSCTNTSNPSVMIGAGLLAKKAVEKGLTRKPWVKSSLAPGSKVVTEYLEAAGLTPYLDQLGFNLVGYGCTTCIGNSGPLPDEISAAVREKNLVVCSVLSGNRNFEGRIQQDVRANYLASPPLVVAYALAGWITTDMTTEPLGHDAGGQAGVPGGHLADRAGSAADDAARR